MGDLVNLKQVKKRIARDEAAKQSETNRARFGRTKVERQRDELDAQHIRNSLDRHRLNEETSA
jgi:hypothetical protein